MRLLALPCMSVRI